MRAKSAAEKNYLFMIARPISKKLTQPRVVWFYLQVLHNVRLICISIALMLVSFLLPGLSTPSTAKLDETIRIAIVKSVPEVIINGVGLLVTDETGAAVSLSFPVTVRTLRNGLTAGGKSYQRLTFASSSVVYVNKKPYRGLAELSGAERGILVVNQLALEDYLVGLINCEISSAWPIEAVKAQAVIARTYAMNRKAARAAAPYHMESSVIDQVYDGCLIEDSRARRAVAETEGMVVTFGGAPIQAFYHSSCGGQTEASEHVWGTSAPYLQGVECIYCLSTVAATTWQVRLGLSDIEERLRAAGYNLSGLYDIKAETLNNRGRVQQIALLATKGSVTLNGNQFRKAIGFGVIKSTRFALVVSKNEAHFSGVGNGHGVGLCQWGAKQRAIDGFTFNEILTYYYPGTRLQKLSDIR